MIMIKYVVMEIQTNTDDTVGTLVSAYNDRNEAESAYHRVLSAAAVSLLPVHAAILATTDGGVLESRSYTHDEQEA